MVVIADAFRRLRRRHAELHHLEPVEVVSDWRSPAEAVHWLPPVRLRGRTCVALACHPASHISFEVTLPPRAQVTSWCSLAREVWTRNSGGVEFEIVLRVQGLERSARRVIDPHWRLLHRRWNRLSVEAPAAGRARVTLRTRVPEGAPRSHAWALWGDPCVETPRPLTATVAALRAAYADWGLPGLWRRALLGMRGDHYSLWIRHHEPSRRTLREQRESSRSCGRRFSLITFVTTPADGLRRTAESVLAQSYPIWEWILVAGEGAVSGVRATAKSLAQSDERVRVLAVASGTTRADAWNGALREASGEFAALLDQEDVLGPATLYEMARTIDGAPDSDLLYSDEDCLTTRGSRRHSPRFKPDWSPDLLLSRNYIGRLAMMRVETVLAVGGFRNVCDGAEEWDLFLRLSRSPTSRIRRVPLCLYHRADNAAADGAAQDRGPAIDIEQAVIREHCQELGLNNATVSRSDAGYRVTWPVSGRPQVSIVIPNHNSAAVLKQCVDGLLNRTSYPHRELVIVDNRSSEPEVLELYRSLERGGRALIVPFDRPFNFSAACNSGVAAARGDLLLFLNNDIEIVDPDWLEELVRWARRPEIGIVGAKLLYPDRTIQHGGVVFGLGLVGHIFSRAPEGASGIFGSSNWYRNYLSVTGACQMMRREVFDALGGHDERFRLCFSDVVLGLEAWKRGLRVVYTPFARLIHHESYTRQRLDWPEDLEFLVQYLQANGFVEDPFFHRELNATSPLPALRLPFDPTPPQVVRGYIERVSAMAAARTPDPGEPTAVAGDVVTRTGG